MTVETIVAKRQHLHPSFDIQDEEPANSQTSGPLLKRVGLVKLLISIGLLGAVAVALAYNYGISEIQSDLGQLSSSLLCMIFAALLVNALAAAFRFKKIAAEIGYSISFRGALATVSASNLAGALFFQIAGQLIARGVVAGRGGIPFPAVVIITVYERIPAAILSAILASAGAFYIFGNIYFDLSAGGAELLKIIVGLTAAATIGALFGYGRLAIQAISPLLNRGLVRQFVTMMGLALLVHLPMQTAYVVAAHALSPNTPIYDLVAASAIVMFATAIPISFAGWGLREMSAIVGLGVIGVSAHAALTAALVIGVGSLLVVAIFSIVSLSYSAGNAQPMPIRPARSINYDHVLAWVLPIGAAVLVFFQIYIPIAGGLLNVNLADPIALLGGAVFILKAIKARKLPDWRMSYLNAAVAGATIVLACSLFIGAAQFGWTTWAWVNRFLGWFVLLAYGATGALGVTQNGKVALRILLSTFVGAAAAISGIEVILVLFREAGAGFALNFLPEQSLSGFSQNHNFLAFQLLMATSTVLIFVRNVQQRILILTLFFVTFWFCGSISGAAAVICVLGTALYHRVARIRDIAISLTAAAGTVVVAMILHYLQSQAFDAAHSTASFHSLVQGAVANSAASPIPLARSIESATAERMITIVGGLKLFVQHPLFGAGLGAFRNQMILATSGIPLVIHSTALWLLAELGVVGLLAFAVPALLVFFTEWRRASRNRVSAFIVLCFVAFGVMSTPADMLYQRTFWLVIGAALAVRMQVSSPETGAKPGQGPTPGLSRLAGPPCVVRGAADN